MIKFENTDVLGWEHAIRGMRNPMNSWEKSDSSNNVITLCGSSKFKDEFIKVQKELSLKGYLVLSLGLFGHSGDEEAWEKKGVLDRVHMQKIDISSSVFVIDVGGYIGESTGREIDYARHYDKKVYYYSHNDLENIQAAKASYIGPNDHDLMMRLAKGGPVHAKYRRMIVVYADITAPLYWWKEFDTYKVGTVANSCSTMHKIHAKEFTLDDFSCEHLLQSALTIQLELYSALACAPVRDGKPQWTPMMHLLSTIAALNHYRQKYLETKDKKYWWQMIQLLPSSYNQKRTVMLNYEVLTNIYHSRDSHKLDEWRIGFIDWIKSLPYSELITECAREEPNNIPINQNAEMPEENYPTACNLCNAYNWGDSDENVCKACQFYKYSKWAPAQSDIQMKQNIVAIAPDTTIAQIRRDLRGYDIGTFPKECDDVTLTPGETIIKHIPPENDEMDEDLIVEKNSDDIEEGFAL